MHVYLFICIHFNFIFNIYLYFLYIQQMSIQTYYNLFKISVLIIYFFIIDIFNTYIYIM